MINQNKQKKIISETVKVRTRLYAVVPAVIPLRNTHHRFQCFSDICSLSHIKQSFCLQNPGKSAPLFQKSHSQAWCLHPSQGFSCGCAQVTTPVLLGLRWCRGRNTGLWDLCGPQEGWLALWHELMRKVRSNRSVLV